MKGKLEGGAFSGSKRLGKTKKQKVKVSTRIPSKAYAGEIIEFKRGKIGNVIAVSNGKFLGEGKDREEAFKDAKKSLREKYDREHDITATQRRYKSKALPLKDLIAMQDKKWREMGEKEQEGYRKLWSPEKIYAERVKIAKKYEKLIPKKPDVRPLIYKTSIGHYGGLYVDVPEECFGEFKSHFPPAEFPRKVRTTDVREKYTFEGEKRFRKRFPSSNRIKEVYFASRSKGHRRLDFLEMPRSE